MQQLRALADKINGGRTGRERGEESAAARFGRGNTWRSHWKRTAMLHLQEDFYGLTLTE
jgi:hypothetical protein